MKVDSVQDQVEALDKKFVKEICERKISLMDLIDSYKNWIVKTETSQIRRKLAQLNINIGETRNCIARKLKGKKTGKEFSADEFFELITESKTSLVSGPAGSGKSTLASSSIATWASSEVSSYDAVLFLSSLQKKEKLPLHKIVWGEYVGRIGKDSEEIYQNLLDRKEKILFIIDGLGKREKKQKCFRK